MYESLKSFQRKLAGLIPHTIRHYRVYPAGSISGASQIASHTVMVHTYLKYLGMYRKVPVVGDGYATWRHNPSCIATLVALGLKGPNDDCFPLYFLVTFFFFFFYA